MCSLTAGRSAVPGGAAGGPGLDPGAALFAPRRRVKCAGRVTEQPLFRDGFGTPQALQRQPHHAGAAVPVAVGGPYLRAAGDERGDIVRADVGADPAGLLGCAEQIVECLAEPTRRRSQARAWPARFRGQGVAAALFAVPPVAFGPAGSDVERESARGRALIDAAAAAGIEHVVFTGIASTPGRPGGSEGKKRIEDHLRERIRSVTVLRPVRFMSNYLGSTAIGVDGIVHRVHRHIFPPDEPVQIIAVEDIAEFAGLAFDQPDRFAGRSLELAGDALTPAEAVAAISEATGTAVRYEQITPAEAAALNPEIAQARERWAAGSRWHADLEALRVIHPGLRTLADWLAECGAAARRGPKGQKTRGPRTQGPVSAMKPGRKRSSCSGGVSGSEHLRSLAGDLLRRYVAQVLGQAPAVPERIDDLSVPLAPEGVLQGVEHLGARVQSPLPQGVHVGGRDLQCPVGAAEGQRRDDALLRELVGDHHGRVPEGELDRQDLAARQGDAAALLRAQRLRVPFRGAGDITHDQVRSEGGHGVPFVELMPDRLRVDRGAGNTSLSKNLRDNQGLWAAVTAS